MTKNRRPLTDADLARIPEDASALLAFVQAHGRPGSTPGTITVVKPRQTVANALGVTVRQLSRAEQHLTRLHAIKAVALIPRTPHEAEFRRYRWIINNTRSKG